MKFIYTSLAMILLQMLFTSTLSASTHYIFVINESYVDKDDPLSTFKQFIERKIDIGDTLTIISGTSGKTVYSTTLTSQTTKSFTNELPDLRLEYITNSEEYDKFKKLIRDSRPGKLSPIFYITETINSAANQTSATKTIVSFINMSHTIDNISTSEISNEKSPFYIPGDTFNLCKSFFNIIESHKQVPPTERAELKHKWTTYTNRLMAQQPEMIYSSNFSPLLKFEQSHATSCISPPPPQDTTSEPVKITFTWDNICSVELRITHGTETISPSRRHTSFGDFYSSRNEQVVYFKKPVDTIQLYVIHKAGHAPTNANIRITNTTGTKEYDLQRFDTQYGRYLTPYKDIPYPIFTKDIEISRLLSCSTKP